jgi:hypothetical protein
MLMPFFHLGKIFNIWHDNALWIRIFMLMMIKPENLDLETVAVGLGQSSSVISLKHIFMKRQLYCLVKLKNVLPLSVATWNFPFIFFPKINANTEIFAD